MTYRIRVVPAEGATLAKRTRQEWDLGYKFKVLWTNAPWLRRYDFVILDDLQQRMDRYGDVYKVEFITQSVNEYTAMMAEVDNDFANHMLEAG